MSDAIDERDPHKLLAMLASEIAFGVAHTAQHIADSQRSYLIMEHIEDAAEQITVCIVQLLEDVPESAKIEDVIQLLIDALKKGSDDTQKTN